MGLFQRLKAAAAPEWAAYTQHAFTDAMADATLPERAFRHYLVQDYLFLIEFARAYALAVYKGPTLDDMREGAAGLAAILDVEMGLHVKLCANWGLLPEALERSVSEPETLAYTRYVLDAGMRGDLLSLKVALAPCVIGYAEIGRWLDEDPATLREGNPYEDWIAMYAGADYQGVAAAAVDNLDALMDRRGGPGRLDSLVHAFRAATELEVAFWQMGLDSG